MSAGPIRLVYFAWVRERLGTAEETVTLPSEIVTAGDLVQWLARRDEVYAHAFEAPGAIRVAVDHVHVAHDEPIEGAREIALFPPMTGG